MPSRASVLATVLLTFLPALRCAAQQADAAPSLKAYRDCMVASATRYGAKGALVDEAIEASKSVCAKQRKDAAASVFPGEKSDELKTYLQKTEPVALGVVNPSAVVDGLLAQIDQQMRPDLARAVLDARPMPR